jgi:hypothetical protein
MAADEAAIRALITNDPDVFHELGVDDDGAQNPEYNSFGTPKITEQINTVRFGRRGRFRLEAIDVEFFGAPQEPDTLAIATITRSFDGKFIVIEKDTEDLTPEDFLIYEKEMENTICRKAVFERTANTDDPVHKWRLKEVSMGQGFSDPTTITLAEITIEAPGIEPITVASPLDHFMDRQNGIPTFAPGDTVKVYATLTNTNQYPPEPGTTLLLHFAVNRRMRRARRPFNDEGIYPDQIAGDGIFSGFWIAQHRSGIYHAVVDAIDNGTIYDDTAPYNSLSWGTLYKVE